MIYIAIYCYIIWYDIILYIILYNILYHIIYIYILYILFYSHVYIYIIICESIVNLYTFHGPHLTRQIGRSENCCATNLRLSWEVQVLWKASDTCPWCRWPEPMRGRKSEPVSANRRKEKLKLTPVVDLNSHKDLRSTTKSQPWSISEAPKRSRARVHCPPRCQCRASNPENPIETCHHWHVL